MMNKEKNSPEIFVKYKTGKKKNVVKHPQQYAILK